MKPVDASRLDESGLQAGMVAVPRIENVAYQ